MTRLIRIGIVNISNYFKTFLIAESCFKFNFEWLCQNDLI